MRIGMRIGVDRQPKGAITTSYDKVVNLWWNMKMFFTLLTRHIRDLYGNQRPGNLNSGRMIDLTGGSLEIPLSGADRHLTYYDKNTHTHITIVDIVTPKETKDTIIDITSDNGILLDYDGNTLNAYNEEFDNDRRSFTGYISGWFVDTGLHPEVATEDISFVVWAIIKSSGFANRKCIFDDGMTTLHYDTSLNVLELFYDGVNFSSYNIELLLNQWYFIVVTRKKNGNTIMYIDSGSKREFTGVIPVVSNNQLRIGSSVILAYVFPGLISRPRIIKGILTDQEILDMYNEEKKHYALGGDTYKLEDEVVNNIFLHTRPMAATWNPILNNEPEAVINTLNGGGKLGITADDIEAYYPCVEKTDKYVFEAKANTDRISKGLVFSSNMILADDGMLPDSSGNGNVGTNYGAIQTSEGLEFNGVDNDIEIPDDNSLDLESNFTIEFIAKNKTHNVISKNWTLAVDAVGRFSFYSLTSGGWYNNFSRENIFTDGDFHHIVILVTSDSLISYIDGLYVNSQPFPNAIVLNSLSLTICKNVSGSGWGSGIISSLKLYNRALTAEEVLEAYNQGRSLHNNLTIQGTYNRLLDQPKGLQPELLRMAGDIPFEESKPFVVPNYPDVPSGLKIDTTKPFIYSEVLKGDLITNVKPGKIFAEPMNGEAHVIANGGTITDVIFNSGKAEFNGTTSYIEYDKALQGIYSVRIKFNFTDNGSAYQFIADWRTSGTDFIAIDTANNVVISDAGTIYVDGVLGNAVTENTEHEIVVADMSMDAISMLIGCYYSNDYKFNGSISLFEIYEGALLSSDVADLYNSPDSSLRVESRIMKHDPLGDTEYYINGVLQTLVNVPDQKEIKVSKIPMLGTKDVVDEYGDIEYDETTAQKLATVKYGELRQDYPELP